jgi:hypothetical protein
MLGNCSESGGRTRWGQKCTDLRQGGCTRDVVSDDARVDTGDLLRCGRRRSAAADRGDTCCQTPDGERGAAFDLTRG